MLACEFLAAQDVELSGSGETAVISNGMRKNGGNELSIGDWYLNLAVLAKWEWVSAQIDWVPEEACVDLTETNSHNANWLRGDGYVSRPSLLPRITVSLPSHVASATLGAFLASGLLPLDSRGRYYLLTPGTLLHSQHWDQGAQAHVELDWLHADVSVVDGEWSFGQPSTLSMGDSHANSSPGVSGKVELRYSGWYVGATGHYSDSGSYPGQKRRQESGLAYVGVEADCGGWTILARAHAMYAARNPAGDGSGRHVPAVETGGVGVEVLARVEDWEATCALTHMRKLGGETPDDGEIWVGQGDDMTSVHVGVAWWFFRPAYLALDYELFLLDEPVSGEEVQHVLVLGAGVEF